MSDEKLDKTEARHQITVPPHSAKPYFGETPIGQLERTQGSSEAADAALQKQQQQAARSASSTTHEAASDDLPADVRLPLAADGVPDLRNRRNAEKLREPFPLNADTAPTRSAALVPGDHDVNISRSATGTRSKDAPAVVPRHGSLAEQRHREFDEEAAAAAAAELGDRGQSSSSSSSSDDEDGNAVPPERVSEAAEAAFAEDPSLHSNDAVKKARAAALGNNRNNDRQQQGQRR